MFRAAGIALVLLATVFSHAVAAGPSAPTEPVGTETHSFLVVLEVQEGYAASMAVRPEFAPRLDALSSQRSAMIETMDDLSDPAVFAVNSQIDALLADMRTAIATESVRRHAPSRAIVESYVRDLGGLVTYESPVLNLIVVRMPDDRVPDLRAHPLVASVEPDGVASIDLDVSVPATGAPTWWAGGFTGGPYKLVVADTGVDATHPAFLGTKISDAQVFHAAAQLQADYGETCCTPDDIHGHGTHVAGIVVSNDATYRGVAYGLLGVVNAKFGYLTNTGGGRGVWSDAMRAIDWGILTAGGDVLSLSFGQYPPNDNGGSSMGLYMDALVDDLGIPISVAAGNSGSGGNTVGIPATSFNVITVGATNDAGTLAGFSSRGPTQDGRLKPDITAPGVSIDSTSAFWEGAGQDFVAFDGTSMAAPHVGGSLILFLNEDGVVGVPQRSKAVLLNSAIDRGVAGPDNNYGWGYIDLASAWTARRNVVNDTTAPGTAAFYRLTATTGVRATLVWNKHVVYNGVNPPTQSWPLSNLDLALYDEAAGNRIALSARTVDDVEQVAFPSTTTGIAKVFVVGALPPGLTQEPFALAAAVAPQPVAAPALDVQLTGPITPVDSGANFVVTANVTDTGGLRLATSTVSLALPPGVTLVAGANPTTLGGLLAGQTRSASWTLTTPFMGVHTFTASASGTGWEETYSASGGPIQVTVRDASAPVISFPSAIPSPQNLGGLVNVSAGIADNVGVAGAWVEVRDPSNVLLGNFTLTRDPITGRYYFERTYGTLGVYAFRIATTDAAGNWAMYAGLFEIRDLEAPVLSAVAATPNPQEVHFAVNVTAIATDNVGVTATSLEIVRPVGPTTNVSMSMSGSSIYLEDVYDDVGTYSYTIYVRDAIGNGAVARGTFVVRDTTAPAADAGPDQTVEAGTMVTFDASASSDNVGIVSYTWTFFDGAPVTLSGVVQTYAFATVGSYLVTLTLRDLAGNSGSDRMTVTVVETQPPTISDVRSDPLLQDVGGVVTVSARVWDAFGVAGAWMALRDPQGGPMNVSMAFVGNDRYAFSLAYTIKGLYTFVLWGSDFNGNWASATGAFEIADLTAPAVTATAPSPVDAGTTVTVTAAIVENDALGTVRYEVRDPAGAVVASGAMALVGVVWQAAFTAADLGGYVVVITATDVTGNLGKGVVVVQSVDRTPPTVTASAPNPVEVLTRADATATVSDNLGAYVATFDVRDRLGRSLGNQTLHGPSPYAIPVLFTALDTFSWTLYAVDPSGNGAVAAGTIVVRDTQPPVADAGPDRTVAQGAWVSLDGSRSTDNFGIRDYTWNFTADGAPQVLQGANSAFFFRMPGAYTVRLLVTDFGDNAAQAFVRVTVGHRDSDADGSWDDNETAAGTNPTVADTDGDGIPDGTDPDPLLAELTVRSFVLSWWGVLLLFLVFLALLVAGVWRRRKGGKPAPAARPAKVAPASAAPSPSPRRLPRPPPPDDEILASIGRIGDASSKWSGSPGTPRTKGPPPPPED